MRSSEKGMMAVELCLSLLVFIALLLFFMEMIDASVLLYRTQAALNRTALELSEYSYLYALSGILNEEDRLHDQVSGAGADLLAFAQAVGEAEDSLRDVIEDGPSAEGTQEVFNHGKTVLENINVLLENPEKLYLGLLYLGAEEMLEESKGLLLGRIAWVLLPKYLEGSSTDQYLAEQGIPDGRAGLRLSRSRFLPDRETLELVLEYSLPFELPFLPPYELTVVQRAVTRAWLLGDETELGPEEAVISVWQMGNFERGRAVIAGETAKAERAILNEPGLHALNGKAADGWEIVRVFSYDATRPTNNPEAFGQLLAEHMRILTEKTAMLDQLAVRDRQGLTSSVTVGASDRIALKIIVVVPENTDAAELAAMWSLIGEAPLTVEIITGYGNSEAGEGKSYD